MGCNAGAGIRQTCLRPLRERGWFDSTLPYERGLSLLKSRSNTLLGACLFGALGVFSLTGCGGGNATATIEPPKARPNEYAARETAQDKGLVKSGDANKKAQDSAIMARRRAAAQGGR